MSAPRDRWLDRDAGPVVRPYAMTKGRTVPSSGSYVGLIDVVVAEAEHRLPPGLRLNPEHRRILIRCREPVTVVDLASGADLPVGVVRVLLSDLIQYGALRVLSTPPGPVTNERLLKDVLDGLQAL
ncbi:MAG: DUF742 domain-containing protein [Streptosporangiaceae bacterium]|nr:DUF742 domain-containing protein [Streptosporangiaceae bacterium]MBV9858329.1 DUF742 domain-containing protein [Streptosporangiaceae bacterium]